MNNFKERLAQLMQSQNLKQGPFGSKIGANQSSVSKWLDKTLNYAPTVEQLMLIAKVYNVNLTWLLTGVGEMYLSENNVSLIKEPEEIYTRLTELATLQKELLECRKETIELYRKISKMQLQK